ncbi:hypothetical protein HK100_006521 [Physocladia obscura]|uniref:Transmembrane protein n=1 Tax=Physocladia obscura TaxID=109957 RepID=A0AAD5T610_9FUNG|nr:hypothetical protein HK100_006521 [Physocladia obscura]
MVRAVRTTCAVRHLSYFRAQPRNASSSSQPATPSKPSDPLEPLPNPKPQRDPMAGFSPEEIKQIKRDIETESKRTFSYALSARYAIIAGGMAVVLAFVYVNHN